MARSHAYVNTSSSLQKHNVPQNLKLSTYQQAKLTYKLYFTSFWYVNNVNITNSHNIINSQPFKRRVKMSIRYYSDIMYSHDFCK